jgi:hypothetical protein
MASLHWTTRMSYDPSRIATAEEARTYLANVRRASREDLVPAAFRRLCELTGQDDTDPLVVDFWRAIAAAEEVLRQQRGKTVRLARTRQKIARVGVHKTVEDLVLATKPSDGFAILAGAGLGDLTAEYLAAKHAERFSPEVVAAARTRLASAGIAGPEVPS